VLSSTARAIRDDPRRIRRHTVRERLNAELKPVKATLRRIRHLSISDQGRYLVPNGFYNYYARALNAFYFHVLWHWLRCLRRVPTSTLDIFNGLIAHK
jgi:hypothetical protein